MPVTRGTKWQERLRRFLLEGANARACEDLTKEVLQWAEDYPSFAKAWEACQNHYWMWWLLDELNYDDTTVERCNWFGGPPNTVRVRGCDQLRELYPAARVMRALRRATS